MALVCRCTCIFIYVALCDIYSIVCLVYANCRLTNEEPAVTNVDIKMGRVISEDRNQAKAGSSSASSTPSNKTERLENSDDSVQVGVRCL